MRIQILHDLYWKLHRQYWITMAKMSPKVATVKWYSKRMGRKLDLETPLTLTEKLQYLKLNDYYRNPVVCQCADKFAVRKYVESKGCGEILNELFAVYDDAAQISWDKLPDQFVLKCNHGCGGNIICHDKKMLDQEDAIKKLEKWMHQEYGLEHVEYSYEGIERKIICEKLIETEDGKPPKDYKFFCSYGTPMLIEVISDRTEGQLNLDYYTPDWEWIPVKKGNRGNAGKSLSKPGKLDDMLAYASKLSEGWPIVRVDLYCEFGKIIFGEMTFCPNGGCITFSPEDYDRKFGNLFPIEIKK